MKRLLYLMILILLGGAIIFLPACSDDESESEELADETDNSGEGDDDDSGNGDSGDDSGNDSSDGESEDDDYSEDEEGTINGYAYIDLGLSVKWATCNIGADSPEGYGNYYAWGEVATKESYTVDNSVTDGVSMSDIAGNSEYDAATANRDSTWRMPTSSEIDELISECTWTWTTLNEVNGYEVTGTNGNSIFLPAAGYCDSSGSLYAGTYGYYWSSTPISSAPNYAYGLNFYDSSFYCSYGSRFRGRSVRPVSD